jgi:hypothetical protein
MEFINELFSTMLNPYLTPQDQADISIKIIITLLSLISAFFISKLSSSTNSKDGLIERLRISGYNTNKKLLFLKWKTDITENMNDRVGSEIENLKNNHVIGSWMQNEDFHQQYLAKDLELQANHDIQSDIKTEKPKSFNELLISIVSGENFELFKEDDVWSDFSEVDKKAFNKNMSLTKKYHFLKRVGFPLYITNNLKTLIDIKDESHEPRSGNEKVKSCVILTS